MTDKPETGFRAYYRGVTRIRTSITEVIFMSVVTLALVVGLPAAIAGIFYGIARLGATWGGGH